MEPETTLAIIFAIIGGIIAVVINIYFTQISRKTFIFNLTRKLKTNELNDDFYKTLYFVLKESKYDNKINRYIIEQNKLRDIISAIENIKNEPDIKLIFNNQLWYLECKKILSKKDSNSYVVSNDFNRINEMIHKKYSNFEYEGETK
jgi:hypothetical protein